MKAKAHGFIKENLISAREARNVSQADLSRLIDTTRQAISQYENGTSAISIETLSKIVEKLNIPQSYFLRLPPRIKNDAIFFRAMSATTKTARSAAVRRFEWLKEIVKYLRNYINFPAIKFPDFDLPDNFRKIDNNLIETVATETRRFWGLGDGVISNVTWLLENNGAIVSRFDLDADGLDAFSTFNRQDETPYIILGADKGVCARSRFDAAHELAHLILHKNIDKSRISHTQDFALIEKQAHRFAGAFLFPQKSYLSEIYIPSLDTFRLLKPKWQVSIQLMIHRGQDLGVITDEQATRLYKNCNRRGWKYFEPYDDTILVEKPRLLSRMFGMLVGEKVRTRADILSALPFRARDITEMAGLPSDFFEEKVDDVISFKDFVKSRDEKDDDLLLRNPSGNGAQILDFNAFRR